MRRKLTVTFAALLIASVSTTSEARFSFGNLSVTTNAKVPQTNCQYTASSSLMYEVRYRDCRTCAWEYEYRWGSTAQTGLRRMGMPIQIDDDGVYTCAQTNGNVYLKFQNEGESSSFWVQGYNGSNFYNNPFVVTDSRIEGTLRDGEAYIWKEYECSGQSEWHSEAGTGGYGGWSWIADAHYFRTF